MENQENSGWFALLSSHGKGTQKVVPLRFQTVRDLIPGRRDGGILSPHCSHRFMIITEMFGGITGDRSGCEQNITEMYCCMASGAVSAVTGTRRLGQARW